VDATVRVQGEPVAESAVDPVVDGRATSSRCLWPAEAGQLPAIRTEVHRRLAPLDLPGDTRHDLVLAVNEAASNAIEHAYCRGGAGGGVELVFWLDDDHLHIAVVDRGTWREPPPGPRGRGFGLGMMRQLVAGVSIDHDDHGTRVVLRHALTDPVEHAGPPHRAPTDGAGQR
jgi:serine/threonine-protein kinase RsbW